MAYMNPDYACTQEIQRICSSGAGTVFIYTNGHYMYFEGYDDNWHKVSPDVLSFTDALELNILPAAMAEAFREEERQRRKQDALDYALSKLRWAAKKLGSEVTKEVLGD
jgi:hypothetical protein